MSGLLTVVFEVEDSVAHLLHIPDKVMVSFFGVLGLLGRDDTRDRSHSSEVLAVEDRVVLAVHNLLPVFGGSCGGGEQSMLFEVAVLVDIFRGSLQRLLWDALELGGVDFVLSLEHGAYFFGVLLVQVLEVVDQGLFLAVVLPGLPHASGVVHFVPSLR